MNQRICALFSFLAGLASLLVTASHVLAQTQNLGVGDPMISGFKSIPPRNYAAIDMSGTKTQNPVSDIALDDSNNAAFGFYDDSNNYYVYTFQNFSIVFSQSFNIQAAQYGNQTIGGPGVTLLSATGTCYQSVALGDTGGPTLWETTVSYTGGEPNPIFPVNTPYGPGSDPPSVEDGTNLDDTVSNGFCGYECGFVTTATNTVASGGGMIVCAGNQTIFDPELASLGAGSGMNVINANFNPVAMNTNGWAYGANSLSVSAASEIWTTSGTAPLPLAPMQFPVAINDNNQVVSTDGYIWTSRSSQPISNFIPKKFQSEVSEINAIDISGTDANGNVSILFTADYPIDSAGDMTNGPLLLTLASGTNSPVLQQVSLPANVTASPWWGGTLNADGLIAGITNITTTTGAGSSAITTTGTSHAVLLVPVELAVDANRDGSIVPANDPTNPESLDPNGNAMPVDTTSPSAPYRFWVNNDQDSYVGSEGVIQEGEIVPVQTPDYTDSTIQCKRDLEDWTRLWIDLKGISSIIKGMVQNGYKVGLQFEAFPNDSTDPLPQIKICESVETTGSIGYLTDDGIAGQQITAPYNTPIQDPQDPNGNTIIGSNPFMLPSNFWNDVNDTTPKHLIFEGCSAGKGKLKLVFYDSNNTKVGEGGAVYLDIEDIKTMYERAKATPPNIPYPYNYTGPNNAPPEPNVGWVQDPNGFPPDYTPVSWQPTQQYIVFVHGWNNDYNSATNTGETLFKGLWQRGYKGRFTRFYWPTYTGFTTFNDSEYRAWKYGGSLKQYMASLPSGYAKDLVSHSMGGVVGGSALQKGMSLVNYVLLNAAIPAECFDTNSALNQWSYTTPDGDADPGTKALGYIGQLSSVSGNLVNFYLTQDRATTFWWPINNFEKPQKLNNIDWEYFYLRGNSAGQKLGIWVTSAAERYVGTTHEAMAYIDQSETRATGGESRTAGAVSGSSDMDNYNFGKDHSAEFNLPIQQVQDCYYDILKNFNLKQIYLDSTHQ